MLELIDSHCHLDYFEGAELDAVLSRAAAAGVGEMITISTRLAQSAELIALAQRPGVWCTVGVHPHNVAETPVAEAEVIAGLAADERVVGIGESGLDYFYDKAPHDVQQASFRQHIRAARLCGLPLVIHARDADEDIAAILNDEWAAGGPFRMLLHCYSSGRALAETALHLGGYVSFSGMLTFPKSAGLRDIARDVPARAAAGGDRRTVPGARAISRKTQRTRSCRRDGAQAGRGPRDDLRRAGGADDPQRSQPVHADAARKPFGFAEPAQFRRNSLRSQRDHLALLCAAILCFA